MRVWARVRVWVRGRVTEQAWRAGLYRPDLRTPG